MNMDGRFRILLGGIMALGLFLGLQGCGSNLPLLSERSMGEAKELQDFCKRDSLVNDETRKADSLLASSSRRLKEGEEEAALADGELAAALYQLALAKRDLLLANHQTDDLNIAVAEKKEKLQIYQQILEETKAVRKP